MLLVDNHFVVRVGLAGSLQLEPDMEVIADCNSGEEALELFRQHKPDVVLMDGRLQRLSGDQATLRLRQEFPDAEILMLSVRDGEEDIHRAVHVGLFVTSTANIVVETPAGPHPFLAARLGPAPRASTRRPKSRWAPPGARSA